MMSHAWPIVLRGGMLSPRGYPPLYALMILSHRVLRYASPLLHVAVAGATLALLREGPAYRAAALAQAGLLGAAAAGGRVRLRPLLVARYYVATTAALAAGPLRPPAPRHAGRVGGPGGDAVSYPGKRALDVAVAGAALVVAAPARSAVAALLIRLETHGHPIYRQRRVGRDGEPFDLYKLRTMVSGAETMGAGLAVDAGDSRITRLGAVLRRTSMDELPNLVNVLRGEMSIVGPRPTVQVQVDRYTERQRGRLSVRPGLTGWAQINGRASLPWHERIELDLWYVEHASLRLDLQILCGPRGWSSGATGCTGARRAGGASRRGVEGRRVAWRGSFEAGRGAVNGGHEEEGPIAWAPTCCALVSQCAIKAQHVSAIPFDPLPSMPAVHQRTTFAM